jgi:hypothetical protein
MEEQRAGNHSKVWGSKSVAFSGIIQETGIRIQVPFRAMWYTAQEAVMTQRAG